MSHPAPDPDELMAALGRAERQAAPADLSAQIVARHQEPSAAARVPLGLVDAWRQLGALLQPAVAGSAVATAAGLALGTWLALSAQSGHADAVPAQPYDASALVDDTGGLAAHYLDDEEGVLGSSDESSPLEENGAPGGPDSVPSSGGGAP
jgi:hypothetical protein